MWWKGVLMPHVSISVESSSRRASTSTVVDDWVTLFTMILLTPSADDGLKHCNIGFQTHLSASVKQHRLTIDTKAQCERARIILQITFLSVVLLASGTCISFKYVSTSPSEQLHNNYYMVPTFSD